LLLLVAQSHLAAARHRSSRPSYYAWFYSDNASMRITEKAFKFYKALFSNDTMADEAMKEFKVKTKQELLDHLTRKYAKGDKILHTTATYCATQEDCAAYKARPAVQQGVGKQYNMTVIGYLLTPRVLGARNHLKDNQIPLWDSNDTEIYTNLTCCDKVKAFSNWVYSGPDENKFTPTHGLGSRSHVTVALSDGSVAVQTGLDLIDLIKCEQECKSIKHYYLLPADEIGELAWARYYGHGRFVMYLTDVQSNYGSTFKVEGV